MGSLKASLAAVPPSPYFPTLSSQPGQLAKLRAPTADGQVLRRKALRGAIVVFFTAGYSGKKFIFDKAASLGVRIVVVDGPDSWAKSMVADGLAERFIAVDMRDADTVFDRTLAEIKARHTQSERNRRSARSARTHPPLASSARAPAPHAPLQLLEKEGLAPDGVCTFNEMSVPIAARLAEALSLPGNPVAAVDAARDKHATRASASSVLCRHNTFFHFFIIFYNRLTGVAPSVMADAGLPTPLNALIEKEGDLDAAAAKVGFPAVIKPIAGAGSMGVVRVDTMEELRKLYAKVVRDMGRAVVTSGALVYAPEDGSTGASTKAFDVLMMMEARGIGW